MNSSSRVLAQASLVVILALAVSADTVTRLGDEFSYITTGNSTSTSGSSTSWDGTGGAATYGVVNAYKAGGAVRLGNSSVAGSLTTPGLALQAGALGVQVDVKGWTTVEGNLVITVAEAATGTPVDTETLAYTAVMAETFETVAAGLDLPSAGNYTVQLGTTAKRGFLDNLRITQEGAAEPVVPVFTVTPSPPPAVEELETVSFTVAATLTNVTVAVTCVTAPLPAGAVFSYDGVAGAGTFVWTTARGDAGDAVFAFSAPGSDGLARTTSVPVKVIQAIPEGSVTLFADDFAYATGGSVAAPSSSSWDAGDRPAQYVAADRIYDAGGSIKLGTATLGGNLTTTNLMLRAGTVTVRVDATGYDADEKRLVVALGGQSFTNTCASERSGGVFDAIRQDVAVAASGFYALTLSTTDGQRVLLDQIRVTQAADENPAAPVFFFTPIPPASVQERDTVAFTVSAAVGGSATNVALQSALPPGASYSYDAGTGVGAFTWTPALGQAGSYRVTFGAPGADGQVYTMLVPLAVGVLPLSAPGSLGADDITYHSFRLAWDDVPGAHGYVVSVWSGSADTNSPDADLERFVESVWEAQPVAPYDWAFDGLGTLYADGSLKFDGTGDTIVSKAYPAAVTQLSFFLKGYSTATTNHSLFRVYGSAGGTNVADWAEVACYDSHADGDGDDANNIVTDGSGSVGKVIGLEASAGYRRFRFVYGKTQGNVAFDDVAAVYAGAGTRFLAGWRETALPAGTSGVNVANAHPDRFYHVLAGARNATERLDARAQVATPAAPRQMILILR